MRSELHKSARPRAYLLSEQRRRGGVQAEPGLSQAAEAYARGRPVSLPGQEGHSLAWLAWGAAALLALLLISNPLYLTIMLLAALVVFMGCARQDLASHFLKLFLGLGAALFLLQLIFSLVTAGDLQGQTPLLQLPRLRLPALLGGIVLGGPITAEQLAWGAVRGLRLWAMLMLLGAFNASVNHYRLIRRVPAFLFQAALVTTVALALVPQTVQRLRAIREAQRLRGHRFRGWRDVLPLLTPLVAGGLERSLTLAEAMESRGYGRVAPAHAPLRGLDRLLGLAAALLLVLGTFASFYSSATMRAGQLLVLMGLLALLLQLRRLGQLVVRTRYSRERWMRVDALMAALALAVPLLLVLLRRQVALDYHVFPVLRAPSFDLRIGLLLLLLAAPALLRPAAQRRPPAPRPAAARLPASWKAPAVD